MHNSQNEGVQPPRRQPPQCPTPARFGAWMAFIMAAVGMTLLALACFDGACSLTDMSPTVLLTVVLPAAVGLGTIITAVAAVSGWIPGYYVLMVLALANVLVPLWISEHVTETVTLVSLWMPEHAIRLIALLSFVLLLAPYSAYKVFAHNKRVFSLPAPENAPAPPASSAT